MKTVKRSNKQRIEMRRFTGYNRFHETCVTAPLPKIYPACYFEKENENE
jgi:hypothetical protein